MEAKNGRFPKSSNIFPFLSTERAFYGFVVSFMVLVPLCEFTTQCFGVPFVTQPFLVATYGILGIIMVFNYIIQNRYSLKFYPSDVFFLLLIIFTLISFIFTTYPPATYDGFDYDEWLEHFYAYYSLLFAGTMIQDKKLRKNILYTYAGVAVLHSIIALAQTLDLELAYNFLEPDYFWECMGVYTLTQNSNWYGGLSVVFLAVLSGLYLFHSKTKKDLFIWGCPVSPFTALCVPKPDLPGQETYVSFSYTLCPLL